MRDAMFYSAYISDKSERKVYGLNLNPAGAPINILLSEKDAAVRNHVIRNVAAKRPHWKWAAAFDLIQCLPLILRKLPDIMVVTCPLSHEGGIQRLEELSRYPEFSSIPLILIVDGAPNESFFHTAYRLGVVDFLRKPFQPGEMLVRIEIALNQARHQQEQLVHLTQREINIPKLEMELQACKNEIAKLNLLLDIKNKELANFQAQIEQVRSGTSNLQNRLQLKRIAANIEQEIHSELHWEMLSTRINHLQNGFLHRLAELHPELTRGEREFCSLLRLNLSIKESARILKISPGSILKKRSRLKKRLGLEKGNTLEAYLQTL